MTYFINNLILSAGNAGQLVYQDLNSNGDRYVKNLAVVVNAAVSASIVISAMVIAKDSGRDLNAVFRTASLLQNAAQLCLGAFAFHGICKAATFHLSALRAEARVVAEAVPAAVAAVAEEGAAGAVAPQGDAERVRGARRVPAEEANAQAGEHPAAPAA